MEQVGLGLRLDPLVNSRVPEFPDFVFLSVTSFSRSGTIVVSELMIQIWFRGFASIGKR